MLQTLFDFFLHLDSHLFAIIVDYGPWVYGLFFAFIFIETGLVVMPFLPGDSLLFAAGTFCAGVTNESGQSAELSLWIILPLMIVAAVAGDSLNYYFGERIGLKVLQWKIGSKAIIKQGAIDKTQDFYDKHGPMAIVLARFVPIVRTFAPFVAGIGGMHYGKFISYNILGGTGWVLILVLTGYFFGNLSVVKNNFEIVILVIVALSLLPVGIGLLRNKIKRDKV